MGYALGYGSGLQFRRRLVNDVATEFAREAIANGYTVENRNCLRQTYKALELTATPLWNETEEFVNLSTSEGYTAEGFSCLRQTYISLQSITLS